MIRHTPRYVTVAFTLFDAAAVYAYATIHVTYYDDMIYMATTADAAAVTIDTLRRYDIAAAAWIV